MNTSSPNLTASELEASAPRSHLRGSLSTTDVSSFLPAIFSFFSDESLVLGRRPQEYFVLLAVRMSDQPPPTPCRAESSLDPQARSKTPYFPL